VLCSLKPWQQRSWIFPRDPDFQLYAARSTSTRAASKAGGCIRASQTAFEAHYREIARPFDWTSTI